MASPARASSAVPVDRLEQLNDIEKEIVESLKNAGASLQELSKDNITKKNAEQTSTAYIKSLQKIETDLLKQINYLSQVSTIPIFRCDYSTLYEAVPLSPSVVSFRKLRFLGERRILNFFFSRSD